MSLFHVIDLTSKMLLDVVDIADSGLNLKLI